MSLETDDNGVPYIQLGKYKIRLEGEELTDELKEKAKRELRESPEVVQKAMQQLREYIKGMFYNIIIIIYVFLNSFIKKCMRIILRNLIQRDLFVVVI